MATAIEYGLIAAVVSISTIVGLSVITNRAATGETLSDATKTARVELCNKAKSIRHSTFTNASGESIQTTVDVKVRDKTGKLIDCDAFLKNHSVVQSPKM